MFCGQCLWWAMPPNKNHGSAWNTIWVSTDHMDLCQTHCKQVPDFSCAPGSGQSHMIKVNTIGFLQFLPTGQHGLCFRCCFSGPLPLCSLIKGPPIGVRFRESLVNRLHSEIDQIHLSIEAQRVTTLLPLGDCHMFDNRFVCKGLHWNFLPLFARPPCHK